MTSPTDLPGTGSRIVIPCAYNSGRHATVRCNADRPDVVHIAIDTDGSRPYQDATDGYLHIAADRLAAWLAHSPADAAAAETAIREININYFAGRLTVISDATEVADRYIPRRRTSRQVIADCAAAWRRERLDIQSPLDTGGLAYRLRAVRRALSPHTERIQVVQPLSQAHLGANWQLCYQPDANWLAEAEARKGGPVYLAH